MQSTKHCKEVTFECRKVTLSHMKGCNHCQNNGRKVTKVWTNGNINAKQKTKTTTHFNISGIKDVQHWKKVNTQKEKNWKAWFSPKLNAKKLGYYPLCLLEN